MRSRIAVKRARYAADLAAHELGKPGARFVAVAKQLQDILGDHQDAVVAQERIREWAESAPAPESGFAAGRLVQLERDRMAAARAAWPDTWQRLDEAARRGGQLRLVRAAGGVVVRAGADGPEVLLVHRPAYDDWTFPKGKLDRGETEEECALREVEEETGLRCTLGRELGSTTYRDGKGRRKRVRYWLMEVEAAASSGSTTRSTRRAG